MSVPVSSELWVFLWTICGGIVLGFVFDIFRIKRKIVKTGIVLITFEDLLYWILAAFIFFFTIYIFNDGQIRGYTIIGCLLGAVFYFSAISPFVLKVSVAVIDAILKGIKFIIKMVILPVKLLIKVFKPPITFFGRVIGKCSGKCTSFFKKQTKSLFSKSSSILKRRKKRKKINKNN